MRRLGQLQTPTWVVVTDFDIHVLWVDQGLSGYCVASEEIAWRLRERGIDDTPVQVTGIPVDPVFANPPDRATCQRELGLDPTKRTILLMSGGHGVGNLHGIAQRILAIPGDHQVVAMAGRNADLLASLTALGAQHPGRLVAAGFTRTPERLMVCADIAIGKPGGLSTSECLALGLPMLVVSPIPGHVTADVTRPRTPPAPPSPSSTTRNSAPAGTSNSPVARSRTRACAGCPRLVIRAMTSCPG